MENRVEKVSAVNQQGGPRPIGERRIKSLTTILSLLSIADLLCGDAATARHADQQGAVETLAGPGYCGGAAREHRQSEAVGAVALDASGNLFFDAGPPKRGLIAKVDPSGQASVMVSGVARGSTPVKTSATTITPPGPDRLAPDGNGGVWIAAGSRLVHLDAGNSVTTVAGDPSSRPDRLGHPPAKDDSPAVEARFISARNLAPRPGGGFFIADLTDPRRQTFSIRFLNDTVEPIVFYGGTPGEITVGPGRMQTIAGGGSVIKGLDRKSNRLNGASPAMTVKWPLLYVSAELPMTSGRRNRAAVLAINLSGEPHFAHGTAFGPAETRQIISNATAGTASGRRVALRRVTGLAADADRSLYIADEEAHRILKVDQAGRLFPVAGTGKAGFNGNDRRASSAKLNRPHGIEIGPDGRVYFSDRLNHQVRVIDQSGVVRAAPGNGVAIVFQCARAGRSASAIGKDDSGQGALSVPSTPASVTSNRHGGAYFSLPVGNQVKKIDARGTITTVAGRSGGKTLCPGALGCPGFAGDGGPAVRALLNQPGAVLAASGGLYVWDAGNARIRFINPGRKTLRVHGVAVTAGQIRTVAGSGETGFDKPQGRALSAALGKPVFLNAADIGAMESIGSLRFKTAGPPDRIAASPLFAPGSLAADGTGNLFIADTANKAVRRVDRSGKISTVAGVGAQGSLAACCSDPMALAVRSPGLLFVADRAAAQSSGDPLKPAPPPSPRIWMLNLQNRTVTAMGSAAGPRSAVPVAGNGGFGFRGDGGPALQAELLVPVDLSFGPRGNLYIAETGGLGGSGGQVRVIDRAGIIKTVAGTGQKGFNGDGLKATVTQLNYPAGVSVDRCGNVFIVDLGNERIRKVSGQTDC